MKSFFAVVIVFCAFSFGLLLTSCNKSSSNEATGSKLTIPNMTAAVTGTTTATISEAVRSYASAPIEQQGSGVLFTGTAPSDSVVSSIFGMVKSFVSYAKTSDSFACMIKVLANNNVLKTDGTETVFSDDQNGQFKVKFVVNAAGSTLQNFKMYVCSVSAVSNDQYVEGSLSGSNMNFIMKFNISGSIQGSMNMDGVVNGDTWSSKTITMETYVGSGTTYATKFQIAQSAANMLFKGTFNTGTLASTYQMYGKFSLLGNSAATYAMGEGSSKYSLGGASDLYRHWDSSGGTSGVTTSAYASDVTSGTYFPANFSFGGALTSAQTWDCTSGKATEVKFTTMNSGVSTAIQSCMENQN